MKKKIIIGLLTFVILLIVGLLLNNIFEKSYTKLTLCEIKTYDGEKIENYQENKRAFIIANYDENAKIKVNGKDYKKNQGFYKAGEYIVEIRLGNQTERSTIKINELKENQRNKYNIYLTSETLPTLFASFDMIKQKDVPSYVWYGRSETLSNEYLKEMSENITFSEYIGHAGIKTYGEKIAPELRKWVSEKLKEDENAYFNIYVTAEYYWMGIYGVEELGLDETRVHTTMYSCGTIDYVVEYDIAKENAYDTFLNKKEKLETAINDARSNLYSEYWSMYFLYKDGTLNFDPDYVILNSFRENVDYYLQYPDLITYKDEKVQNIVQSQANMKKIVAKEQFNSLTDGQKQEFFKCINLNKESFDKEYFNKENGKYLVITGTNPYYGRYIEKEFNNMINQVLDKYGSDYKILYKPHPSAIPNERAKENLNNLGIEVLPGKMPMEAISFIYSNIKLGGFGSSLYMSVDERSTLFFFIDNSENLVSPLNILYDDLFTNAELIQPKK